MLCKSGTMPPKKVIY